MAETDILNPSQGYDPELGDSMNPNQGWQRSRTQTAAFSKPAGGSGWGRETSDNGYTYKLNYTRRNLKVTERLNRFFDEFEFDFFTFIDWDTGRHYVGRFTGERPQTFDVNGRFSSQGWTFEEVPGAPMIEYPSQWDRWAIKQRPFNGMGDPLTACYAAAPNAWQRPAAIAKDDGTSLLPNQLQLPSSVAGDWVTHEYRGYGFRLSCVKGVNFGQANLLIDGAQVALIDFHAAHEMGPTLVYENAELPLGFHRVQLVSNGLKSAGSAATAILWDYIEVMR